MFGRGLGREGKGLTILPDFKFQTTRKGIRYEEEEEISFGEEKNVKDMKKLYDWFINREVQVSEKVSTALSLGVVDLFE